MQSKSKNTLTLIASGLIVAAFLIFGALDILDYIIVKIILFSSFALLAFYLIGIIFKDSENKQHNDPS